MRTFEGRKFCQLNNDERDSLARIMRSENPELITIAAPYDSFDYPIGDKVVRCGPRYYLKALIDLIDNPDSMIMRDNFIDYQIKICKSALFSALEDLWDEVMESDEEIELGARERAKIAAEDRKCD